MPSRLARPALVPALALAVAFALWACNDDDANPAGPGKGADTAYADSLLVGEWVAVSRVTEGTWTHTFLDADPARPDSVETSSSRETLTSGDYFAFRDDGTWALYTSQGRPASGTGSSGTWSMKEDSLLINGSGSSPWVHQTLRSEIRFAGDTLHQAIRLDITSTSENLRTRMRVSDSVIFVKRSAWIKPPPDLVRRWFLRRISVRGTLSIRSPRFTGDQEIDTVKNYAGTEFYADFKADSTYEFRIPEFNSLGSFPGPSEDSVDVETGKWRIAQSTLTTISTEGDSLDLHASMQGGTLVLESESDTSFASDTFSGTLKTVSRTSFAK